MLSHRSWTLITLLAIAALLLSACTAATPAPAPTTAPEATAAPEATQAPEATTAPEPTQAETSPGTAGHSVVARLKAGETLRAGVKVDSPPWGFLDESGQNAGFDVDLIRAMADKWGVEVEFIPVTSSTRLEMLAAGQVDMVAASMTHKKDRDQNVDFTQTYFLDGQALLVKEGSGIQGLEDLGGKTVASVQGSTSIQNIQKAIETLGLDTETLELQTYTDAAQALVDGRADAVTTDASILAGLAANNPGLVIVGKRFSQEPYGMGVPTGDSHFMDLVNFTLQDLFADGTYAEIYDKWLGQENGYIKYPADMFQVEVWPGATPALAEFPDDLQTPESRWDMIKARGRILAGVKVDSPPWGFLDEGGQNAGFDVEILTAMAERLGFPIEFTPVTSSTRLEVLQAGQVDLVAASMTHKKDRDANNDFTQTYFLDGQALLVKEGSGIQGLEDLGGKTVASVQGSTSIQNIQKAIETLGLDTETLELQTYTDAAQALVDGRADAVTTDASILAGLAANNPGLVIVGKRFSQEPYGMGVPQFDPTWRDLVNFTLQELFADGTYAAIYDKWLGQENGYIKYPADMFQVEVWPGTNYVTATP